MASRRSEAATHREGPGDLAHIDVPPRVHGDAMWSGEAPRRARVIGAPPREHTAVRRVDTDPATPRGVDGAMPLGLLSFVPPQLRDIGTAPRIEDQMRRPLGVRPLG